MTAGHDGTINGCTVAWFCRSSLMPPCITVSIAPSRMTHDMILHSGAFGVNILKTSQLDIARYFGKVSGRDQDKFENTGHFISDMGIPLIKDCSAVFECRLISYSDAGDHTLFTGEIVSSHGNGESPLIFNSGDYAG